MNYLTTYKMTSLPRAAAILIAVASFTTNAVSAPAPEAYSGQFISGEGDTKTLDALNAAFECARVSPRMGCLPMCYKRDWSGFVEGPTWPCWWVQNSFGPSYGLMPFLGEEPYASWIGNAQGLWFRLMGDGKRKDSNGLQAPDGCLMDAGFVHLNGGSANFCGDPRVPGGGVEPRLDGSIHVEGMWYRQGDGNVQTYDWFMGATAGGLVLETERLLVQHDPARAKERLPQLYRVAAFLDSRRDPAVNLLKAGRACNLLAPAYAGVKRADGTYDKAFLTEVSVNYVAGIERLAEVCELCGETARAESYRQTASLVRQALPRLMTSEGCFIMSEDADGTRHGVYGAAQHGYFESAPNHDAGCFRVTDDAANRNIIRTMLSLKGTQPPGGLAPNGLILPNYPSYDDHSGEGDMTYGTWVNGGHWTTTQGRMSVACFRAGEFAHPLGAWAIMRRYLESFRADAPLAEWGVQPWGGQLQQPYNVVYDCWGAPAGVVRGLFEYRYTAKGLRLWSHLPPTIRRYVQKVPVTFGKTKIYLSATGQGELTGATVDGKTLKPDKDGSVFLANNGGRKVVAVELLLGQAKPQGTWQPAGKTEMAIPPATDRAFWSFAASSFDPPRSANHWPLRIGGSPAGGLNLTAQVKGVRIYQAALTEEQVADRANGKGDGKDLIAEYLLDTAPAGGKVSGAKDTTDPKRVAALTAISSGGQMKAAEGGLALDGSAYLDIPASAAIDFFENYTLEIWVRPTSFDAADARIMDRSTPGAQDGYLLDYREKGRILRLITPWGVLSTNANLQLNQWQHLVATCDAGGLMRLFVNGRKVGEIQGTQPVAQPTALPNQIELSALGAFLHAMDKAGKGDTFEAGQARVAVEMLTALHERHRLAAQKQLPSWDLRPRIPPANQEAVDRLYYETVLKLAGGLQDHLEGRSIWKPKLDPEIVRLARSAGLVK